MSEEKSNVVVFPLRGTRMATWFNTALAQGQRGGLPAAQLYISKSVPEQLQWVIHKNVRIRMQ